VESDENLFGDQSASSSLNWDAKTNLSWEIIDPLELTLDYSYLTIDDGLLNVDDDANRIRFQWDVSF
jgi:hypothetical protein